MTPALYVGLRLIRVNIFCQAPSFFASCRPAEEPAFGRIEDKPLNFRRASRRFQRSNDCLLGPRLSTDEARGGRMIVF